MQEIDPGRMCPMQEIDIGRMCPVQETDPGRMCPVQETNAGRMCPMEKTDAGRMCPMWHSSPMRWYSLPACWHSFPACWHSFKFGLDVDRIWFLSAAPKQTCIVFKPSFQKVPSDHQILNSQPQGPDPENHLLTGGFKENRSLANGFQRFLLTIQSSTC